VDFRFQLREILPAVGTDLSHSAVSSLDFELRKVREFQNSSRGVRTEMRRPNSTCTAGKISRNWKLVYFWI